MLLAGMRRSIPRPADLRRITCKLPVSDSMPVMWPRRVERSAEISPNRSPGMLTSMVTIVPGARPRLLERLAKRGGPAVLNACSELSTGWSLRRRLPLDVDNLVTRDYPLTNCSRTPFSTAGMN